MEACIQVPYTAVAAAIYTRNRSHISCNEFSYKCNYLARYNSLWLKAIAVYAYRHPFHFPLS